MMKYRKEMAKAGALFACAFAWAIATAPVAQASMHISICDDAVCAGGGDAIVFDNGVGDLNPVVDGMAITNVTVAGITFAINTAVSQSPGTNPLLSMAYQATAAAGGGGTVWFYANDNDFTPTLPFQARFNGTLNPGSTTGAVYGGVSNGAGDISNTIMSFSPPAGAPFDLTSTGPNPGGANPYNLTLGVVLTLGAGQIGQGDITVSAVPEPGSLLLLGTGLLGLAAVRRRLR